VLIAIEDDGFPDRAAPPAATGQAARLLRPGGELIFLVNGVLAMLTPRPP
jgi:hypothetical protein